MFGIRGLGSSSLIGLRVCESLLAISTCTENRAKSIKFVGVVQNAGSGYSSYLISSADRQLSISVLQTLG